MNSTRTLRAALTLLLLTGTAAWAEPGSGWSADVETKPPKSSKPTSRKQPRSDHPPVSHECSGDDCKTYVLPQTQLQQLRALEGRKPGATIRLIKPKPELR